MEGMTSEEKPFVIVKERGGLMEPDCWECRAYVPDCRAFVKHDLGLRARPEGATGLSGGSY